MAANLPQRSKTGPTHIDLTREFRSMMEGNTSAIASTPFWLDHLHISESAEFLWQKAQILRWFWRWKVGPLLNRHVLLLECNYTGQEVAQQRALTFQQRRKAPLLDPVLTCKRAPVSYSSSQQDPTRFWVMKKRLEIKRFSIP